MIVFLSNDFASTYGKNSASEPPIFWIACLGDSGYENVAKLNFKAKSHKQAILVVRKLNLLPQVEAKPLAIYFDFSHYFCLN